jgi:WD40 repeat protein
VEIWDVASGQAVCAPLQHPSRAGEIAWLDETHLVTTCGDFQVRTWKIPEGTVEASRPGPRTILGRLTGNLFLVRGKQGHELFDVSTGTHQLTLTDTEHSNLRLTPNQRFYAETQGNTVTVSTVAAPPKILFRRELDRDVSFAVVDDAAQHLAVAYMDFSIEIIGINGRDRVAGPFRHRSVVREMMFSPDGCILASGSDDGTLRLWDVSSGEPLSPPLRHGSRVIRIHFRPDGRAVATACSDGVARVWQIPSAPEDVQELKRLARRLNALGE